MPTGWGLISWIVGHTRRFRAASPETGVTSLFSEYGAADLVGVDDALGSPYDQPEAYWDRSPMNFAGRIATPTLIVHGQAAEATHLYGRSDTAAPASHS